MQETFETVEELVLKKHKLVEVELMLTPQELQTFSAYCIQNDIKFNDWIRSVAHETLQNRDQEQLKNNSIFESTGTGIAIIEEDGRISFANSKLAEILEANVSNIVGSTFLQWVDEEDRAKLSENHKNRVLGKDIATNYDFKFKTKSENIHWASVSVQYSPETKVSIVSILDIHTYKQIEQKLELSLASQNAILSAIPDLMFELDANGCYINIWASNPEELASSKELLLGKTVNEMLPKAAAQEVMKALQETASKGQSFGHKIHIETPEGFLWFELSASCIQKESKMQHFILLSRNITKRVALEEQLKHISNHDALTGLSNRRKLDEQLSKELYKFTRNKNALSVLFFDIDKFKIVNDDYGHESGDIVLQEIGKVVKSSIRESDSAYRYGGEEFVIVMEETAPKEAFEFAERLRLLIQEHAINLNAKETIHVTISIGVASLNNQIKSINELIKLADDRMYKAKRAGRNCVVND